MMRTRLLLFFLESHHRSHDYNCESQYAHHWNCKLTDNSTERSVPSSRITLHWIRFLLCEDLPPPTPSVVSGRLAFRPLKNLNMFTFYFGGLQTRTNGTATTQHDYVPHSCHWSHRKENFCAKMATSAYELLLLPTESGLQWGKKIVGVGDCFLG